MVFVKLMYKGIYNISGALKITNAPDIIQRRMMYNEEVNNTNGCSSD